MAAMVRDSGAPMRWESAMLKVTPACFSLIQKLRLGGTVGGLCMLLLLLGRQLTRLNGTGRWWPDSADGKIIFLLLALSGLALAASALRSFTQGTNGFIGKPLKAWQLDAGPRGLTIAARFLVTDIAWSKVRGATLAINVAWDRHQAGESDSLLLDLGEHGGIRIPGSSQGYKALCARLAQTVPVQVKDFHHDVHAYF